MPGLGICSFAHSLFALLLKLLFFLRATVSDLLSSLFTKEPPKANCSRCSLQKSHHERFTLFQEQIAIWLFSKSEFLFRSFPRANHYFTLFQERIAISLFFQEGISISLFRSQKTSDLLKKPMSKFPIL